jgi:hypothetical protein
MHLLALFATDLQENSGKNRTASKRYRGKNGFVAC